MMNKKQQPNGFKGLVKRYSFLLIMLALLGVLLLVDGARGETALDVTLSTTGEMLLVIPPIFVLIGLLDVWVPRETMVKYMGEGSGFKGALLAVLIGTAAAGPLLAAFPVAAMFMKKGAKYSNVVIFLGAWSTTKIPMLTFEVATMGWLFGLTRLAMSVVGITLIALIMNRVMKKNEVAVMYQNAQSL